MAKRRQKSKPAHGRLLTELMFDRRLTNRAAAQIAGVSPSSIQDWKTGVSPTDFVGLSKLADHLGVSLRYLLIGKEGPILGESEVKQDELLEKEKEIISGICKIRITRLAPDKQKKAEIKHERSIDDLSFFTALQFNIIP